MTQTFWYDGASHAYDGPLQSETSKIRAVGNLAALGEANLRMLLADPCTFHLLFAAREHRLNETETERRERLRRAMASRAIAAEANRAKAVRI